MMKKSILAISSAAPANFPNQRIDVIPDIAKNIKVQRHFINS